MKIVKFGIMPSDKFEQRLLKIASGEYKPAADEPKIWFSSLKSMAEVLSENNLKVLELIEENKPASVTELAKLSGRQLGNLSRTLKTFEHYGIIELKKEHKSKRPTLNQAYFKTAKAATIKYGTFTLDI